MKAVSSGLRKLIAIAATLCLAACGPELTEPSDVSLAGTWTSNAKMFTLSEIRMEIVQEPKGIVSGEWFAKGTGGRGCPPTTPCNATGPILGLNLVAQIQIDLQGAGTFEGGLVESNKLRGIFVIETAFDTITFVRQGSR